MQKHVGIGNLNSNSVASCQYNIGLVAMVALNKDQIEGEFKKRILREIDFSNDTEAGEARRIVLREVTKWIEDAKQEIFGNIKLVIGDKFHGFMIQDEGKMVRDLMKWFGMKDK